jgi:hypothetical protein
MLCLKITFNRSRILLLSLGLGALRPVTASRQHCVAPRLFQLNGQLVQARLRMRGLETQQVAAVQVIGEVVYPGFKASCRIEHFVLPAALGRDCLRSVLAHGLRCQDKRRKQIRIVMDLGRFRVQIPIVVSPQRIEHV